MKTTHQGKTTPRLPHERDESSDSGQRPPDPVMRQAAADAESGRQATDRGEETDALYARTLRGEHGDANPASAPTPDAGNEAGSKPSTTRR